MACIGSGKHSGRLSLFSLPGEWFVFPRPRQARAGGLEMALPQVHRRTVQAHLIAGSPPIVAWTGLDWLLETSRLPPMEWPSMLPQSLTRFLLLTAPHHHAPTDHRDANPWVIWKL
jgi:hypothetical protein